MKRISIILVGVVVVVLAAGAVVLKTRPHTPPAAQNAPAGSGTRPAAVTIQLPHASPINALVEDYEALGSTWLLVSKTHPLSDPHYQPIDLKLPSDVATNMKKSEEERKVRAIIASETKVMFDSAAKAGIELYVASGYRSYDLQNYYYSNYVKTSGEVEANKFSAKPGQSEHQIGLAFDVSLQSNECYLETCFGDTAGGKWLAAHAHEYGFILRYPADKTVVTGYQYEPWHFRYVGNDLAAALYQSGLTLDEAEPYLKTARTTLRDHAQIP